MLECHFNDAFSRVVSQLVLLTSLGTSFIVLYTSKDLHQFSNAKCHYPIYRDRCKKLGIQMHDRAVPVGNKMDDRGYAPPLI